MTVKEELSTVPAALVMRRGPVAAVAGTITASCVDDWIVNLAGTPPNNTDLVPVKFVPVMVRLEPGKPYTGAIEVTVGALWAQL